MPDKLASIDFASQSYYPSLRSRGAEMKGYAELPDVDKNALLPIIVLSKWHNLQGIEQVTQRVTEQMEDHAFIVDHTRDKMHFLKESRRLLDPAGDFEAWRNLVKGLKTAVPVAQITDVARPRDVAQQAVHLERDCGRVAIRVRDTVRETQKAVAAVNAVDDIANLLVIIDLGYIRGNESAKLREAIEAINALRDADPRTHIVCMSTSYPRSVVSFGEESGALDILERRLFALLGGDEVATYGDHASIHVEPYEPVAGRWVPRVDYPLPGSWVYRRHRTEDGGFVKCAQEIVSCPDWDPSLPPLWGAQKIVEAAAGNVEGMGGPASWISVRVNIHIHRQLKASRELRAVRSEEEGAEEEDVD